MMYEEFNRIASELAGRELKADLQMYNMEIEPTYMCFAEITKKQLATMYWNLKRNSYTLWLIGKDLMKEKLMLDAMTKGMETLGLMEAAKIYRGVWCRRRDDYVVMVNEKIEA